MIDLGEILTWLKYRRIQKNRKVTEGALKELHSLTVTFHGRIQLAEFCEDEESDLAPELRRMYYVLLRTAPIDQWAEWN